MKLFRLLVLFNVSFISLTGLFAQVLEVHFYPKDYITMDEATSICHTKGWQIATPEQIKEAWVNLNLHQYAFGMMSDGRFAVPVQKDYPNFKKDPNIGVTGGNQGFFYVIAPAKDQVDRTISISELSQNYDFFAPVPHRGNFRFKNRSAYTLVVEKYLDGKKVQDFEVTAGLMKQYTSPSFHTNAIYKGYVITGLVWEPRRLIFEVVRGNGDLTIKTVGTTLDHSYEVIRN